MPLIINVLGSANLSRRPERATLAVTIYHSGPDAQAITSAVTSTTNKIQSGLSSLAPQPRSSANADGPITHWSMSSLSTGSFNVYLPTASGEPVGEKNTVVHHSAQTNFSIRFKDFSRMGSIVSDLAKLPHVQIRGLSWSLTDATREATQTEARAAAVKDAIKQAKEYAAAVGKKNVVPVEMTGEADGGGFGSPFGRVAAQMPTGALFGSASRGLEERINFEPQDVDVGASVRVRFEGE